jgi:hypothetical protein
MNMGRTIAVVTGEIMNNTVVVKPEETLAEARSGPDVQFDHKIRELG